MAPPNDSLVKNKRVKTQRKYQLWMTKIRKRLAPKNLGQATPIERLGYAIVIYILIILTIYLRDQPHYGGSNRVCKSLHYDPPTSSKNNATYPFPNTFNRGRTFTWQGSDSGSAFQHVQQFGTHNSYHVRHRPFDSRFWYSWFFWLVPVWRRNMDYEHSKIEEQLDRGYRTFELDIHIKADGVMNYHVQMWDQETHCYCLGQCLQTMKRWSLDNPGHGPIVILLEPKTDPLIEDSYTLRNDITLGNLLDVEQEILRIPTE